MEDKNTSNYEYLELMNKAIELDINKGHLRWSVTELSISELAILDSSQVSGFINNFIESRLLLSKYPMIRIFYLTNREKNNSVGLKIQELEKSYQSLLRASFKHLTYDRIEIIRTLLLGLSYYPNLSREHIENTIEFLMKSFFLQT